MSEDIIFKAPISVYDILLNSFTFGHYLRIIYFHSI